MQTVVKRAVFHTLKWLSEDFLAHLCNTQAPTLCPLCFPHAMLVETAQWLQLSREHSPWVGCGRQVWHFAPPFTGTRETCSSVSLSVKWEEACSPPQDLLVTRSSSTCDGYSPNPLVSLCTPQSGGPLLPWWHSTGWRCLEITTTGGSREAEPVWWSASEERPRLGGEAVKEAVRSVLAGRSRGSGTYLPPTISNHSTW